MGRVFKRAFVVFALVGAAMAATAQGAFALRDFTPRFSIDAPGNITLASNTLMTCDPTGQNGAACPAARTDTSLGAVTNAALNNNSYNMVNVDIDSDPSTANSSTAALSIPAGASVAWAGLYWSANAPSGLTPTAAKAAKFKGPDDASYLSINADVYDPTPGTGYAYSCFKDVTSLVEAQGSGAWTLAGIQTNQRGVNAAAGWTLIVVYESANEPMRNLTVFDGQATVGQGNVLSIPVSGFRTPAVGQVNSEVGLVTYEGDRGAKGDYAQLDDAVLSDGKHLADNFFNSWIAIKGAGTTGRNPDYGNQLGYDAAIISAPGVLKNNATSADIRTKTANESYEPLVATFATELYAPRMLIDKSVLDVNGGEVRVGDELEYTIDLQNDGADGAVSTVLSEHAMPAGTEYVGGSLLLDGAAPPAGTADQPGDGSTAGLALRLGTGADGSTGGLVAPGESHIVKFRVRVKAPLPPEGGKITNRATLDYAAQTLGSPVSVDSPVAEVVVHRPDVAITKTVTSAGIVDGQTGQYTLAVKNVGQAATDGTTTVTDTIPSEITSPVVVSSPGGWSCSIAGQLLTCDNTSAVAPGSSFGSIVVAGLVANAFSPPHVITNTATVTTPLDENSVNDSSTVSTSSPGFATMTVDIRSDKASVLPGEPVKLTGSYGNTGPSAAQSPTLTLATADITDADVDVSGFTVTSSDGSVTAADCALTYPSGKPTVTCTPSLLAKGATVEIVLTLVPKVGTTLTQFDAEAESAATNDSGGTHTATTTIDIEPTADLVVTKSVSSPTVDRGNTVDFTIKITNNGPRTSGPVNLYDTLPEGLTPESATWGADFTGGGSCTIKTITRVVTCAGMTTLDIASPAPGNQEITVTITARAALDVSGVRENTAQASSNVFDPDEGNNSASASVTILPLANLNITKTGPTNLAPGATGTYTVAVTNLGPSAAPNTVVTDTLDPNMTVVAPLPAGCTVAGKVITCLAGNLAAGDPPKTYEFKVKIASTATAGSTLVNEANASSDVPDPDPSSAKDEVKVVVAREASAKIATSIKTPRSAIRVGSKGTITVSVKTASGGPARGVVVCATIPSNVTYLSSTGKRSGSRVCWSVSSLARGAVKSWSIRVKAKRPGTLNASVAAIATNASRVTAKSPVRVASAFTG